MANNQGMIRVAPALSVAAIGRKGAFFLLKAGC
jgi:hypothetical protein